MAGCGTQLDVLESLMRQAGTLTCSPSDRRFLAGGDSPEAQERRNSTFKLIPRVTEGSWIVKQSVGTTPCLMGRKLHTRYHRCSLAPALDAWPPPSVPADACT